MGAQRHLLDLLTALLGPALKGFGSGGGGLRRWCSRGLCSRSRAGCRGEAAGVLLPVALLGLGVEALIWGDRPIAAGAIVPTGGGKANLPQAQDLESAMVIELVEDAAALKAEVLSPDGGGGGDQEAAVVDF